MSAAGSMLRPSSRLSLGVAGLADWSIASILVPCNARSLSRMPPIRSPRSESRRGLAEARTPHGELNANVVVDVTRMARTTSRSSAGTGFPHIAAGPAPKHRPRSASASGSTRAATAPRRLANLLHDKAGHGLGPWRSKAPPEPQGMQRKYRLRPRRLSARATSSDVSAVANQSRRAPRDPVLASGRTHIR